jgi:aspartate ammonia-lyase
MTTPLRVETDSLGTLALPAALPYGIQTYRAVANFPVSGTTIADIPGYVPNIARIKKAAAIFHGRCGVLEPAVVQAIVRACEEIIEAPAREAFPVDVFHGGGGTSANMNVNEVVALRATQLTPGAQHVDALDHVNFGQSTNDVVPSAMKMTMHGLLGEVGRSLRGLVDALARKEAEFTGIVKLGRTCLQDALPLTLGQQFSGYRTGLARQLPEIDGFRELCLHLPLGATAVGTQAGTVPGYSNGVYQVLADLTGLRYVAEGNFFDGLQNADLWLKMSALLTAIAQMVGKFSADLRLMASGPRGGLNEITLPAVQPGSSIMPGKVNPVIPEMAMQVYFRVLGNHVSVARACEGELDLNVWESLILHCLAESAGLLAAALPLLQHKCVDGLVANREVCENAARASLAMATVVAGRFGHEVAISVAQDAAAQGKNIEQVVVERGLMTTEVARASFDPVLLTQPPQATESTQWRQP